MLLENIIRKRNQTDLKCFSHSTFHLISWLLSLLIHWILLFSLARHVYGTNGTVPLRLSYLSLPMKTLTMKLIKTPNNCRLTTLSIINTVAIYTHFLVTMINYNWIGSCHVDHQYSRDPNGDSFLPDWVCLWTR